MATAMYEQVYKVACAFVPPGKAAEVLQRQLTNCSATPETFTADHLKAAKVRLRTALALYVPDEAQRQALHAKIEAL